MLPHGLIHGVQGLVQQQCPWAADPGGRQQGATALPFGKLTHGPAAHPLQPGGGQGFVGATRGLAAQPAHQSQDLQDRGIGCEVGFFRKVSQVAPRLYLVRPQIMPAHADLAGIRLLHAGGDLQQGALAAPVRTE